MRDEGGAMRDGDRRRRATVKLRETQAAMQCTLLIPHLIWPRAAYDDVARDLPLPALTTLLARSTLERHDPISPEAWLCQAFEVERQHDWPLAPLTLALDGGEPSAGYS